MHNNKRRLYDFTTGCLLLPTLVPSLRIASPLILLVYQDTTMAMRDGTEVPAEHSAAECRPPEACSGRGLWRLLECWGSCRSSILAAPIVAVHKKDGRVRLCGDYKVTVNPVLELYQYPLPQPTDLFATLAGGQYFSTLDLSHAYNLRRTPGSTSRYTRLPFGVASAPALFQKSMDIILQGLDEVICYLDDILVSGRTEAEHLDNLKNVFRRLREHGIRVKNNKCSFMKSSVQYLGHRIDAQGLHATDDKIRTIKEVPVPKNIQELRSFLGLLNYYGRFISNLSSLIHPLNELLRRDAPWKWSKQCASTFESAKAKIVASNVLVHYDPSLPMHRLECTN